MDWCSWLSKTSLEPPLPYEYGLTFARNELQLDDVVHFNHEFLQSMGISVAKHRLEILKLARREVGGSPISLSRVIWAFNRSKRLFTKKIGKWAFHKDSVSLVNPSPAHYQSQWTGALRKRTGWEDDSKDKVMIASRNTMRSGPMDRRGLSVSGPLDGRMQERPMFTNWSPTLSRTLDGRVKDRWVFPNRSPSVSWPLEGRGLSPKMGCNDRVQSLWSVMFQDMKPT